MDNNNANISSSNNTRLAKHPHSTPSHKKAYYKSNDDNIKIIDIDVIDYDVMIDLQPNKDDYIKKAKQIECIDMKKSKQIVSINDTNEIHHLCDNNEVDQLNCLDINRSEENSSSRCDGEDKIGNHDLIKKYTLKSVDINDKKKSRDLPIVINNDAIRIESNIIQKRYKESKNKHGKKSGKTQNLSFIQKLNSEQEYNSIYNEEYNVNKAGTIDDHDGDNIDHASNHDYDDNDINKQSSNDKNTRLNQIIPNNNISSCKSVHNSDDIDIICIEDDEVDVSSSANSNSHSNINSICDNNGNENGSDNGNIDGDNDPNKPLNSNNIASNNNSKNNIGNVNSTMIKDATSKSDKEMQIIQEAMEEEDDGKEEVIVIDHTQYNPKHKSSPRITTSINNNDQDNNSNTNNDPKNNIHNDYINNNNNNNNNNTINGLLDKDDINKEDNLESYIYIIEDNDDGEESNHHKIHENFLNSLNIDNIRNMITKLNGFSNAMGNGTNCSYGSSGNSNNNDKLMHKNNSHFSVTKKEIRNNKKSFIRKSTEKHNTDNNKTNIENNNNYTYELQPLNYSSHGEYEPNLTKKTRILRNNSRSKNLHFHIKIQEYIPIKHNGCYGPPLMCYNPIDDDMNINFIYLDNNIYNTNTKEYFIRDPTKILQCNCTNLSDCSDPTICPCAQMNLKLFKRTHSYIIKETGQKILNYFSQEDPIFECDPTCKCNKIRCRNSYLNSLNEQKLTLPKEAFRLEKLCKKYGGKYRKLMGNTGIMWGLKTICYIPSDFFIMEYIGEIINRHLADKRGETYDAIISNYLFDLNSSIEILTIPDNDKQIKIIIDDYYIEIRSILERNKIEKYFPLCIDAHDYGNLSRFINHSCEPNLKAIPMYIEFKDLLLPRIGLFTLRDINKGEELTLDYSCAPISDQNSANCKRELVCLCGSRKCRGYVYRYES